MVSVNALRFSYTVTKRRITCWPFAVGLRRMSYPVTVCARKGRRGPAQYHASGGRLKRPVRTALVRVLLLLVRALLLVVRALLLLVRPPGGYAQFSECRLFSNPRDRAHPIGVALVRRCRGLVEIRHVAVRKRVIVAHRRLPLSRGIALDHVAPDSLRYGLRRRPMQPHPVCRGFQRQARRAQLLPASRTKP